MKNYLWIASICLFLLIVRFTFYYSTKPVYKAGDVVKLTHTLLTGPTIGGNYQYIQIEKVGVYLPRFPRVQYGDSLIIKGTIKEQIAKKNKGQAISKRLVIENPEVDIVDDQSNLVLSLAAFIRQKVTYSFNHTLPGNFSSLLIGIVFGIREGMDRQTYEMLKKTGVLHVVAASGMNVTLLSSYVLALLSIFLNRKVAVIGMFAIIIFYAIISGLDPSIIRATIMGTVAFSAQLLGRQNTSYIALLLAAFGMIFVSPGLLENVGFQLSFAATFGILTIKPLLDNTIKSFGKKLPALSEDLTTTVSAQASTFPILIFYFGSFSAASLLVNIAILWTIPYMMIGGLMSAVLSLIHPILAMPILYLTYPLLLYFLTVVELSSSFAFQWSLPQMPQALIIAYYFMLLSVILLFARKKNEK